MTEVRSTSTERVHFASLERTYFPASSSAWGRYASLYLLSKFDNKSVSINPELVEYWKYMEQHMEKIIQKDDLLKTDAAVIIDTPAGVGLSMAVALMKESLLKRGAGNFYNAYQLVPVLNQDRFEESSALAFNQYQAAFERIKPSVGPNANPVFLLNAYRDMKSEALGLKNFPDHYDLLHRGITRLYYLYDSSVWWTQNKGTSMFNVGPDIKDVLDQLQRESNAVLASGNSRQLLYRIPSG